MTDADHPRWSTPTGAIAALALGGAVLAGAAALVVADTPGRFLVGFAALVAFVTAGLAWRRRPRLEVLAGDRGIATTRVSGRHEYAREALHRVRIVEYPRLGRRVPMLEIDTVDPVSGTENLMIFGRWDLGTDPRNVHEVLAARDLAPDQTPS